MISQSIDASTLPDIPQLDKRIKTASDYMRLWLLSDDWAHCVAMAGKRMHLFSDSDIPDSSGTVPSSRY